MLGSDRVLFRALLVAASVLLLTAAAAPADKKVDPKIQEELANKYPGQQIAAWCGGNFLDRAQDATVALHDPGHHQFRVLWIMKGGKIRELQAMAAFGAPSGLELKCLDARQAKQLKQSLQHSEAIRDFLHVPAGKGALCYFVDPTETKCWSVDKKGMLVEVGGWQT